MLVRATLGRAQWLLQPGIRTESMICLGVNQLPFWPDLSNTEQVMRTLESYEKPRSNIRR